MRRRIREFIKYIRENRFARSLMKYFDWPLLVVVLLISLFGIVCIFSATSSQVLEKPANVVEMLQTQSIYYPRLQLMWIGIGLVFMALLIYFPYDVYYTTANWFYYGNILLLLVTLMIAQAGRGGMTAFLNWGNDRGFQTSEVGKIAIIISLAALFKERREPINSFIDLLLPTLFVAVPLFLIILQPDFGTGLVYVVIFATIVFMSGTNKKLIWGIIIGALVLAVPVWYYVNNSASDSFRLTRIMIWLNPEAYPDDARQVINAQIAIGSGGLFGKGIISPGSFASLGYISDDHTDFIFAIVCESFGLVGGAALILAYMFLLGRMIVLASRVKDHFGIYLIVGVIGMMTFHIVENIGMVIGLLPVTGIPLPFVSYGGSNMLTNMMGIGLVENVVMRDRQHNDEQRSSIARTGRILGISRGR